LRIGEKPAKAAAARRIALPNALAKPAPTLAIMTPIQPMRA
jgi:hypothetical protein